MTRTQHQPVASFRDGSRVVSRPAPTRHTAPTDAGSTTFRADRQPNGSTMAEVLTAIAVDLLGAALAALLLQAYRAVTEALVG